VFVSSLLKPLFSEGYRLDSNYVSDHLPDVVTLMIPARLGKLRGRKTFNAFRPHDKEAFSTLATQLWSSHTHAACLQDRFRVVVDSLVEAARVSGGFSGIFSRFQPKKDPNLLKELKELWSLKSVTESPADRKLIARRIWTLQKASVKFKLDSVVEMQVKCRRGWGKKQQSFSALFKESPNLCLDGQTVVGTAATLAFFSFYRELYASPNSGMQPQDWLVEPLDGIDRVHFDLDIVKQCLPSLSLNSSSGTDDISAAMLQSAGDTVLSEIAALFTARANGDFDDLSWGVALVSLLPKTPLASQVKDFRPITVLSVLYKLYEKVLLQWAINFDPDLWHKIGPEHHGFRPGFQVCEPILVAKLVIERSLEYGVPLCILKVDILKAFDRIGHGCMTQALEYLGIHPTIVRAMYRELQAGTVVLRTPDGHLTDPVQLERGVRQGGCTSPALFIFGLSFLLKDLPSKWRAEGRGWVLDDTWVHFVAFADDLLLLARSPADLQGMLSDLVEALGKGGLELSADKAEWSGNDLVSPSAELRLHGSVIHRHGAHESWRYLGAMLNLQGDWEADIARQIANSWKAFWSLRSWLLRRTIPRLDRLRLWTAALDATCLWGSGTWRLSKQDKSNLRTLELQQYRKIAQHPRRPDERGFEYRARTARLLRKHLQNCKKLDLVGRAAKRIWTFAGHCARLEPQHLARKLLWTRGWHYRGVRRLFTDAELNLRIWQEGRRVAVNSLGRSRSGHFALYDGALERFCRNHFGDHWLDAAQDRERWREAQDIWGKQYTSARGLPNNVHE
jgi:hypothetical protein